MNLMNLRVRMVESSGDRNQLVKFPFRLYKDDPYWVAQLIGDRKAFLDPKKNPSFEYLQVAFFLAEAVVHVATAPKSNAAHRGLEQALADIAAGRIGAVPRHLRDGHGPGGPTGYRSAHDAPHAVAAMQYLPDALTGRRYYEPSDRGYERQVGERLVRIRQILDGA